LPWGRAFPAGEREEKNRCAWGLRIEGEQKFHRENAEKTNSQKGKDQSDSRKEGEPTTIAVSGVRSGRVRYKKGLVRSLKFRERGKDSLALPLG